MHQNWYLHSTRMEESVFSSPLEGLARVRSEEGKILTKPFLDICKSLLPVLGMLISSTWN